MALKKDPVWCARNQVVGANILNLAGGPVKCAVWLTSNGQLMLRALSLSYFYLVLYQIRVPLSEPGLSSGT